MYGKNMGQLNIIGSDCVKVTSGFINKVLTPRPIKKYINTIRINILNGFDINLL